MNNRRLLTGLLSAALSGGSVHAFGQSASVVTLEKLFEIAETRSVGLRPARASEEEAERAVDEARAARLPDIEASLSVSYIGDGFTTERDFSDCRKAPIPHLGNGLALNVVQPVYAGGAITYARELAELKSTAARYRTELQRDDIRFRLTGFYLDLYKYANLRTVVENNILQARKVLAEMQARYEQGVALQNDITRYELLLSNLELQLVKIDDTVDILNRNLTVIAGLPADVRIEPDTTILSRALPTSSEAVWLNDALQQAPALQLARSNVAISRKSESLVKAERRPKIGIRAGWSLDGPILVEVPPIDRNLGYWYVGVGITCNLSALYKSSRSLSRSRAATRVAADELNVVRENIELSLRADYVRYMEACEELKTRRKSVELAERNYATTFTRYTADMALLTDMLDAANARLDAQQRLVNARIDVIYYYYKLLFTSGKI